jgi:arabinofuranosyltransferase
VRRGEFRATASRKRRIPLAPAPAPARPAPSSRRPGWLVPALAAPALGWLFSRAAYFSAWMDDDAFISFRYARNLVRGLGLVFNPGERVEGYSNFLWTVLLAAFHRVGFGIPETARVLGCLFSLLTILLLLVWGPRLLPTPRGVGAIPRWLGALAALLLCTSETWAVWAVGGLENELGAFLVLCAFLAYFRSLEGPAPATAPLVASGTACALAAMTHPSYALFGSLLGAHLLVATARGRGGPRALAAFAGPIVSVALPYGAWKLAYYGHLLPNTFRAKVAMTPAVLFRGARYFRDALSAFPLPFLVLTLLPVALVVRRVRDPRPWLLVAAVVSYCAYGLSIGGESFPAFRLLVVVLPLLFVLVQYAVGLAAGALRSAASRNLAAAALSIAALAVTAVSNHRSPRARVLDVDVEQDLLGLIRTASLALTREFPPGTLFAYSGAGVVAFYTGFPFIDTLGLTDAHIAAREIPDAGARDAGHEKGDGRYVLARAPHVIQFSIASFTAVMRSDDELMALPGFRLRYRRVLLPFTFAPRGGAPRALELPLFVRRDLLPRPGLRLVAGEPPP